MNKIKLLFFVIFFTLYSNVLAVDVTQTNISSQETNCNGGTWNIRYYNGEIRYFRDILTGTNSYEWIIGFTSSNIKVYNPYNSLNIRGPFVFKSNIKPEGIDQVVVCSNDAGTVINRGTLPNRNNLAGQIVYSIARKYNNGYITGTSASYNYTLPDRSYLTKNYTNKPNFNSAIQQDNECFNIYVDYCGDGLLDTSHGEICDDGNNINGDGCSATCQRETVATCNNLRVNPNSGTAPLTSTFTCSATAATSYRINIYSGSTIINTINSSVGTYTFTNTGSYTARCTINGSITSAACQKSITVGGTTPTPNIDIDKRDANPADLDGVIGNDTQTVNISSGAVFKIRVTNNFTESLTNLVLTDAVAPNCAGSVTLPGTHPSTWSSFTMGGLGNHTNNTLEPGEYFEYICSRANTTVGYTNSARVNGVGIVSNQAVTDTDTTVVLIPGPQPTPNIDINKLDANSADLDGNIGNDTQTVNVSSGAVFRIRVTNNFTESLTNLVLTDVVAPNCAGNVTLPTTFPSTWTGVTVGGSGSHTNAILEVGEYIDYVCDRSNTTVGYTNSATVNGVGLISNQSVTDTDTTVVLIPTISGPTCGTAGGYVFPYTTTTWPSNLTFCSTGAIPNPNPPVFPAINGSTSWTCSENGSTVNCSASRGDSGGGGGGGGGSGPSCTRISIPALEATGAGKAMALTGSVNLVCYGNSHVGTIGIDCDSDGNGSTKSITEQKTAVTNGAYKTANFTCTYNTLNTVPHPKCYVTSGGSTVTTNSTSSLACSTGLSVGANYCGDGVIQRPNDNHQMEVCEKSINATTGLLEFPFWCTNNCQTLNFTYPGEGQGILTYPGGGSIYFRPYGQVIIGAGSNPFTVFGSTPYIGNDSSEDIYLDYPLCVYNTDSSVLLNSNNIGFTGICSTQKIGWLYPGISKTFESLNSGNTINIKGLKITDNISYKDTILKTTLQLFPDAFFSTPLKVRVSKPAVATVGGGTSLIKNSNITADINKVADGYMDEPNKNKNKNFVGAGVSTGSTSSYSKNVTVTNISSGQTQKVEKNLTKVTTTASIINKNIGDPLTMYNGLSNVFIVKGNLTINTSIPGTGARTYIVEGGNLYINQDIIYADNIAFVVKGGNIIIDSSVKKITGTLISIKVASIGGKIMSDETDNKLVINGSLYGDIENLVNNRTHIENKNDLINVGTIVSFGSNLFRKQAPLVGDFIGEYIASKKVAK